MAIGPVGMAIGQTAASIGMQLLQNNANRRAQERANRYNKEAADTAYQREMQLLKYQLDYNTPSAQMQRFKDAGLNPNLIYGQGSPGNMQSAPNVPVQAPAHANQVSLVAPDVLQMVNQSRLMSSQADLIDQKVVTEGVSRDLKKAQIDLVKANPYLKEGYVDALVMQTEARAQMLDQERRFKLAQVTSPTSGGFEIRERGLRMMQTDYDVLLKRSGLLDADAKIKAQILESKEFQNQLNQLFDKWIQGGEVDGDALRYGMILFLNKLRM